MTHTDTPVEDNWTLATDEDGDLRFNDRTQQLEVVEGQESVAQVLKTAIGTVKGEDPVDVDFGLDIFKATGSTVDLEREIRRVLLYDDYRHDRVETIDNVAIYKFPGTRNAHVVADVTLEEEPEEIHTLTLNLQVR